MMGRSLQADKDPFCPCEKDEDVLGVETPYLSAIGVLMYLANCTRHYICFAVNLLARYSSTPTQRHWTEIRLKPTERVHAARSGLNLPETSHSL